VTTQISEAGKKLAPFKYKLIFCKGQEKFVKDVLKLSKWHIKLLEDFSCESFLLVILQKLQKSFIPDRSWIGQGWHDCLWSNMASTTVWNVFKKYSLRKTALEVSRWSWFSVMTVL